MDYEKAYKEALERAKKELKTCGSMDCDAAKQIFRFFPELAESEDERIRKEIIECVKNYGPAGDPQLHKKMIAWLERQGESFTKKDVDDARLKGIGDAKRELEKQGEHKPAWSEEDEDALDIAIRIIQNGGDDCAGILDSDKALKWLKSLKGIVQPKPKQGEQKQKEYSLEELELK